jgi:XTP/dITP diphosphohydrolase
LIKNRIWMATSNANKVSEASNVLANYGIKLEHYLIERVEIQADDPAEIAAYSLSVINENIPICVEDTGVSLNRWNGFPGPYSSYVLQRLGNSGILKLMEGERNRKAQYVSALAYRDESGVHVFRGIVDGEIAHGIYGTHGFGCDPIFIPAEGDGRTFGEMNEAEKNKISHRARAFHALAKWLTQV